MTIGQLTIADESGNGDLDTNFNLVDPSGGVLQGFGIDEQFNIIEGVLEDVAIPIRRQAALDPFPSAK